MKYKSKGTSSSEELNIWSAFTDLMSNAFLILIFLLFMLLLNTQSMTKALQEGFPVYEFSDLGKPGFTFESKSAKLPEQLIRQIQDKIARELTEAAGKYKINVIEVIGHTDGESLQDYGKLDECLQNWKVKLSSCIPGSNADLGLLRALAVVKLLQELQENKQLSENLQFRPYSAAQLISPNKELTPAPERNLPERRRIEIRLAPKTFKLSG